MASDRIQRQIERFLDEAEEAVAKGDWVAAEDSARKVLAFDPNNNDAVAFIAAAERALNGSSSRPTNRPATSPPIPSLTSDQPNSFANGRYQVKRFLGEGGKKKVYLATDTLLDRDVAFALIKTEGLDEVSQTRITPEAQAMGRLGLRARVSGGP